jgi:hypothetical protein
MIAPRKGPVREQGNEGLKKAESTGDFAGSVMGTVPGWLISLAIHAVILIGATLLYFERALYEDDSAFITQIRRPDAPKLAGLEQPPKKKAREDDPADAPEDPSLVQDPGSQESLDSSAGTDQGQDSSGAAPLGVAGAYALGAGSSSGFRSGQYGAGSVASPGSRSVREKHVKAALRWLARHQNADGSWSVTQFQKNCGQHGYSEDCSKSEFAGNEQYDVGVTGLALLAFLGGGYAPSNREPVYSGAEGTQAIKEILGEAHVLTYGEVVKRACKYLLSVQDASGRLGPEVDRYIYNHLLGTLALTEAYRITGIWLLRGPAQRGVQFLVDSRTPRSGWRYGYRAADTDSSVSGWAVSVLRSAEAAGLSFDRSLYDDVRKWFDQVTVAANIPRKCLGDETWDESKKFTLTGYLSPKDAGRLVSVSGINEHYSFTPALTAIMVLSSVFMDGKASAKAEGGVETLLRFLPSPWSTFDRGSWRKVDFYYWYHASYALFQLTSPDDDRWKRWGEALRRALMDTQNLKGFDDLCAEGSWEPIDRWSCEGGRVYATAMGALTLEVYYRFPKVLGLATKGKSIQVDED